MSKYFIPSTILLLISFLAGCSQWNPAQHSVIPGEEDFRSVLMLSDGKDHLASGFILVRNNREYIITAKHFAGYMTGHDSVELFVNGGWIKTPTYLIGHAHGEADISVFSFTAASVLRPENEIPILSSNETLERGAETWYLGFPLGYMFESGDRNYPYPLLKHAYLSAQNDEPYLYYFDGLCNPGFSGGPVYAITTQGNLRLIAVISARLKEPSDAQSSGIFLAYSIRYAEQLIDANPIGAQLK